jgi:serine/threonine kinase 32
MGSGCSSGQGAYDPNVLSIKHFDIHRVVGKGGFGKVNAVIRRKTDPPAWFAMKTLSKATVLEKKCVDVVWNERNLLTIAHSPLIVRMHHTFQDSNNCYVVMDLLMGGDLKFHLGSQYKSGFAEEHVRFYVAGILLSLEYLHSKCILHRDVKPENIILDDKGYPHLTDLGVSVQADAAMRCHGTSGTVAYMAPEIFMASHEHGVASDLFCLGVVTFELLFGKRPWPKGVSGHLENSDSWEVAQVPGMFSETQHDRYYPRELLESTAGVRLSSSGRAFIRGLLHPNEHDRLGGDGSGAQAVKHHEWMSGLDWQAYVGNSLAAPFQPVIDESKANCDTAAHDFDDVLELSSAPAVRLSPQDQEKFAGFEYNVDVHNPEPLN